MKSQDVCFLQCGHIYSRDRLPFNTQKRHSDRFWERPFFACSACGKLAGAVQLLTRAEGVEIIVASFTSKLTAPVKPNGLKRLRKIISVGDARALHRFDFEFAPFFCPECKTCYCGDHWMRRDVFDEDGWHDSIRGRCPAGHERMLED